MGNDPNLNKYFSLRLRNIRNKSNLTKKAFSESIGLNETTYSRLESGATVPDAEVIFNLWDNYGVDPNYFILGGEKMFVSDKLNILKLIKWIKKDLSIKALFENLLQMENYAEMEKVIDSIQILISTREEQEEEKLKIGLIEKKD